MSKTALHPEPCVLYARSAARFERSCANAAGRVRTPLTFPIR